MAAGLGLIQFTRKWLEALALHRDFYDFYLDQRITGFQNHWQTFSGQELYLLYAGVRVSAFRAGRGETACGSGFSAGCWRVRR